MDFLKKLFHFYVFSNLHVAIAGFSFTRITEIGYGINNCFASLFVGLSIVLAYNFIRYYEIKTERLVWFRDWFNSNLIILKLLAGLSFLGLLILILNGYVSLKSLLFVAPFAIMTFFYVIPLIKIGEIEVSFRNLPFIKIFSISIAWAGVTTFFPIINFGIEWEMIDYLFLVTRFLFVFAIIIPFDIRDLNSDSNRLKTIPQIFGVNGAKIIGVLCMLLAMFLTFSLNDSLTVDIVLICCITILFLLFSSLKRSVFYASFFVESIPIVWLIIIMYFS